VFSLRSMPVCVGLIMLTEYFCHHSLIKGQVYFNKDEGKAAWGYSALLLQSSISLVSHNCFINFFAIVQCSAHPKSALHKQAAKLFQQHWRHLKGKCEPQFCLWKGRQMAITKAYRQSVWQKWSTNITVLSQRKLAFTGRHVLIAL
jgi:hypothetical protein